MSVLRAHDYPAHPVFRPNARALRGILAALGVTAFLCFSVVIALLPGLHPSPRAVRAATRYRCDKPCMCNRERRPLGPCGHRPNCRKD